MHRRVCNITYAFLHRGLAVATQNRWPKKIKKLRATLDVSQVEFANLVGSKTLSGKALHPSTVAGWENGRSVPNADNLAALVKIAKELGHPDLFED